MSEPVSSFPEAMRYAEYRDRDETDRYEIIQGTAYAMTGPSVAHQDMARSLLTQIDAQLQDSPCQIWMAPLDVLLSDNLDKVDEIKNIVQPDLFIVCDPNKIKENYCLGAPDLIIEILSPSTALRDMNTKLRLYETFHVKEYWIVHPLDKWVQIYSLSADGKYGAPDVYDSQHPIFSKTQPQISVDLS